MTRLDDLVQKTQELNDLYSKALATVPAESPAAADAARLLLYGLANYMVSHWDTISAITTELSDVTDRDDFEGLDF